MKGTFSKRVRGRRARMAHRIAAACLQRGRAPAPSLAARVKVAFLAAFGRLVLVLRVPIDVLLEAFERLAVAARGLLLRPRRRGERKPVPGFLVVGHRGSPARHVENTISSCEAALGEDGANAVEIDLCVTRDGEVVIWHDWDPNSETALLRQVGAEPEVRHKPVVPGYGDPFRRPICDLTLAEVRAHCRYADADRGHAVAAVIPTFPEFAAWAAARDDLRVVFLDVKVPPERVDLVPTLLAGVSAALAAHPGRWVPIYLTPYAAVLEAILGGAPGSGRSLDVVCPPGIVFFPSRYSAVRPAIEFGHPCASAGRPTFALSGWSVYRRIVETDLALRERHATAHPERRVERYVAWTLNDPAELRALVSLGVDGILTDHPARLRSIVGALNGS